MADNFAAKLAQAKLTTSANTDDFVENTDFDNKLNLNDKVTSNKTKHGEAVKKLTDLTKKLNKYQKNDMIFYLVECIL